MNEYALVTDGTCDIPREYRERYNIEYIPMKISISNETLVYSDGWEPEEYRHFYDRLRRGEIASTTQITPFEYEEVFEKYLSMGQDVMYLCFSSGMSDTIQSARLAKRNLEEKHPDRKIYIVDSLSVTIGLGMLVMRAFDNRENGMPIGQNVLDIESVIEKGYAQWFTVDNLAYLGRSGRLNTITTIMGSALQIKPIIEVSDGKLVTREKVQGRKSSYKALVKKVRELSGGRSISRLYIANTDAPEIAKLLYDQLVQAVDIGEAVYDIEMSPIIGSHVGPGLVAVFFVPQR